MHRKEVIKTFTIPPNINFGHIIEFDWSFKLLMQTPVGLLAF